MLTSAFYESGTYLIALNADIACLTNVPLVIMAINIILYVCVCMCTSETFGCISSISWWLLITVESNKRIQF